MYDNKSIKLKHFSRIIFCSKEIMKNFEELIMEGCFELSLTGFPRTKTKALPLTPLIIFRLSSIMRPLLLLQTNLSAPKNPPKQKITREFISDFWNVLLSTCWSLFGQLILTTLLILQDIDMRTYNDCCAIDSCYLFDFSSPNMADWDICCNESGYC